MSERRTTGYLIGLGVLFLLLIGGAYLGRAALSVTINEKSWTQQNELVLASLPVYPGSIEERTPYTTGERDPITQTTTAGGGPYRGYWTTHSYTLPLGSSSDLVLSYYAQHLGDWSGPEPAQGTDCAVTYRRGRAMLDLKACGGLLILSVNYREYES